MTYEIWSNMAYRFTTFRTEYNYSQFIDGYKDFAPMLMSYKGETDAKLTCPDDYNIFLGDIFNRFNADDRPNGAAVHSLSVGDVVKLGGVGFACEAMGWHAFVATDWKPVLYTRSEQQ